MDKEGSEGRVDMLGDRRVGWCRVTDIAVDSEGTEVLVCQVEVVGIVDPIISSEFYH